MTIHRLYYTLPLHKGMNVTLEGNQAHYLIHVLRLREGDQVLLFQEKTGEYVAKILHSAKKTVTLEVQEQRRLPCPAPDIWLCFAPIKAGRIDFLAEKATELGISQLVPVKTDRTIVSRVNEERLYAHMIEAAEQSERMDVPAIQPYQTLEQMLSAWDTSRLLIYGDESGQGKAASDVLAGLRPPLAMLIGPEGGFSEKEHALLQSLPFCHALSLGARILRADTAALASLTLLQLYCGDWYDLI